MNQAIVKIPSIIGIVPGDRPPRAVGAFVSAGVQDGVAASG